MVDHINGVGTDNRIANLRAVTASENSRNLKLASNNKSGMHGVGWRQGKQKWRAYIQIEGKQISLGNFDDIKDAVSARLAADKKYNFHANHGQR